LTTAVVPDGALDVRRTTRCFESIQPMATADPEIAAMKSTWVVGS
jgi:hypothetical protein